MVAAFLFFFNAAHFAVGLAYILSANLIAMGIFTYVKNVNNQVTKAIEDFSNPSVYCLPARFQQFKSIGSGSITSPGFVGIGTGVSGSSTPSSIFPSALITSIDGTAILTYDEDDEPP
ncbi:hypothetical protein GCK72_005774 [Caenorhabditis remanei]|uniref:Uncharacterized protein n=1 Tax=Caenorhabditis remanei TaxID=31234 RepID=A0A6A5HFK5_CAERE|nr:hypothetical protein GCK72_005774 [Caenorhabditis remanei]KAF1765821.1 hypothetical protein GCK72_005774 [Caenorhabditis remanei]